MRTRDGTGFVREWGLCDGLVPWRPLSAAMPTPNIPEQSGASIQRSPATSKLLLSIRKCLNPATHAFTPDHGRGLRLPDARVRDGRFRERIAIGRIFQPAILRERR